MRIFLNHNDQDEDSAEADVVDVTGEWMRVNVMYR